MNFTNVHRSVFSPIVLSSNSSCHSLSSPAPFLKEEKNMLTSLSLGERLKKRRSARGVTLVEVLIVIAILGLIAGGIAVVAFPRFRQAQKETAKMEVQKLYGALQTWKVSHPSSNECPKVEELKTANELPSSQSVNDTWGTPFKIVCTTDDFGVMSAGPDKKENTEDDIWAGAKPTGQ